MAIIVVDRKTGARRKEVVAGEAFLNWSCQTILGRAFMNVIGSRKVLSTLMGCYQNSVLSKRQIHSFVKKMEIDMKEAERSFISDYSSFNDFFSRELKPGARLINTSDEVVTSPADGRVLAYQNLEEFQMVQVKGKKFSLKELLANSVMAEQFKNGSCVVVRLNPSDYHRFHFPITCKPGIYKAIEGKYYSVNPVSLNCVDEVYCRNARHITYLRVGESELICMVEVGATMVGSVVQTYEPESVTKKGEEKGYFQFGGSTVIVLFPPNKITLDSDLIANTMNGLETMVKMGESLGKLKDVE